MRSSAAGSQNPRTRTPLKTKRLQQYFERLPGEHPMTAQGSARAETRQHPGSEGSAHRIEDRTYAGPACDDVAPRARRAVEGQLDGSGIPVARSTRKHSEARDDLDVGVCSEPLFVYQAPSEHGVVVDFAVADDVNVARAVWERLMRVLNIHDTQDTPSIRACAVPATANRVGRPVKTRGYA